MELKRISRGIHLPIKLNDNIPVILGRKSEFGILNKRVSKMHVEACANIRKESVTVKQIGKNPSRIQHLRSRCSPLLPCNNRAEMSAGDLLFLDGEGYTVPLYLTKSETPSDDEPSTKRRKDSNEQRIDDQQNPENFSNQAKMLQQLKEKYASQSNNDDAVGLYSQININAGWNEDEEKGLITFVSDSCSPSTKVAGFDVDGTIISTKSGRAFPKNEDDWQIMLPEIPAKLKRLISDNYRIVLISNQAGFAYGHVETKGYKRKIEAIISRLGVKAILICSTKKTGYFRKPCPGMWDHFCEALNGNIRPELDHCLYVGDAAGRQANWKSGKKKDHSCVDRLFARNIGCAFYTPEEFFTGDSPASFLMPEFDPQQALCSISPPCKDLGSLTSVDKSCQLLLCVGAPGSGKSHFVKHHLLPAGYSLISRDVLGSWQKCVAKCESLLSEGKPVVVDNTNPDKESRKRYIDIADKVSVPVRCLLFSANIAQCLHNEAFRVIIDKAYKPLPRMAFNTYSSRFQAPNLDEGFTEIINVNFQPQFESEEHKRLYGLYLTG